MAEKLDLDALERSTGDGYGGIKSVMWIDGYTVCRLIARIRELESASQPGGGEADTARLDFLIEDGAVVDTITNGEGEKRYQLAWPDLNEAQNAWYSTARAAIDAMIAATGAGNGEAKGGRGET